MQSGNLYVYGVGNPVAYVDTTGNFIISTTLLLIISGAVLVGTAGGLIGNSIANQAGATGWSKVGYIAGCAAIGAVVGGAAGWAAAPAVVSATGAAGISVTTAGISTVAATVALDPQWQELFIKCQEHIFSKSHINDGILNLGTSQEDVFNKIMNVVMQQSDCWTAGSNEIHVKINDIVTTIRFYIENGNIIKVNASVGISERVIGKLIDLIQ